jgi:hypothetical protein
MDRQTISGYVTVNLTVVCIEEKHKISNKISETGNVSVIKFKVSQSFGPLRNHLTNHS